MILKSIALRNIRSYHDQRIDFPEGSTLLAGDIGSGKSSILHSIEFALFGARRDSISGEALLRKGEKEGEVELSFSLGKDEVTIRRKLKRQQGSVTQDAGFISINNRRIDGTATELKARMLDLLGYPKELLTKSKSLVYRYTVYTPQEEMKNIIMEPDELRIDTLRKVFGIDRYKRIAENAAVYIRSMKEEKKELAGVAQGIDGKKKERDQRKKDLAAKQDEKKVLLPSLDAVRKKKDSAKQGLASIEENIRILNGLRKDVEVFDARLSEIVRVRSRNASDVEILDAEIQQLNRRLEETFLEERHFPPAEEVEKDIERRQKEMTGLSSRKTELNERSSQVRKRIAELEKEIDAKTGRAEVAAEKEVLYRVLLDEVRDKEIIAGNIDEIARKLEETQRVITELSANRSNSERLKGEIATLELCPTCRQEVSEVHKRAIIDDEDRKIRKLTVELDNITGERNRISAMLKKSNSRFDAIIDKERKLAAMKVEISNLEAMKKELESVRKQHAELDRQRIDIMSELGKLDDRMIERLARELDEKKAMLKGINGYALKQKEKKHNLALLADKKKRREDIGKHQEQLKQEVGRINSDRMGLSQQILQNLHVEKEYIRKKHEFEDISDEEKRLEVRIGGIGKEIEGIESHISMLSRDIAQKQEALERISYLSSVQEWLERMFINLMTTMEKQIMARVHTRFSELFSTWFNLLIEDETISVRIDESFSPLVTQNGHDISIEHLSGGEKTSIALAYRLALNKVINDIISTIKTRDLLILDEPTDGFSSEQLDKVRTVLDEISIKQVILVSHESKIESFVDNVIRLHKNEHVSRVVS
jgi:DNA repair protein SbcC/Rad50